MFRLYLHVLIAGVCGQVILEEHIQDFEEINDILLVVESLHHVHYELVNDLCLPFIESFVELKYSHLM